MYKQQRQSSCLLILNMTNQEMQNCGYNRSTVLENTRLLAASSMFRVCIETKLIVPQYRAHLKAGHLVDELIGLDHLIHSPKKHKESALDETSLLDELKKNEISQVYLCGNSTDTSIYTTMTELIENKYEVFVISDATTSINGKRGHQNGIQNIQNAYGFKFIVNTSKLLHSTGNKIRVMSPSPSEQTNLTPTVSDNPHLAALPEKKDVKWKKPNWTRREVYTKNSNADEDPSSRSELSVDSKGQAPSNASSKEEVAPLLSTQFPAPSVPSFNDKLQHKWQKTPSLGPTMSQYGNMIPVAKVSSGSALSPAPRRKYKTSKVFTDKKESWDRLGNKTVFITKYITEPNGQKRREKSIEYIPARKR